MYVVSLNILPKKIKCSIIARHKITNDPINGNENNPVPIPELCPYPFKLECYLENQMQSIDTFAIKVGYPDNTHEIIKIHPMNFTETNDNIKFEQTVYISRPFSYSYNNVNFRLFD